MKAVLASLLAIFLGAVAGGILIAAIQCCGMFIYPPPSEFDWKDKEAVNALMANAPVGALLLVLLAYAVGTTGGAFVATLLARRVRLVHGLIVGALFLAASLGNLRSIRHPEWFAILNLGLIPPAAYLGARLVPRRSTPVPPATSAA